MNDDNKLVPNKLADTVVDDTIKSKDGKPLKSIIKDVAEACKSVTDPDKYNVTWNLFTGSTFNNFNFSLDVSHL